MSESHPSSLHPRQHALANPHKPAVIFSTGEVLSYGALEARANQAARLIRSHGIIAGDRVALFMDNETEWFELIWACQRIGVCVVPISSRLTAHELGYILADCGARLLFASPALADTALADMDRPDIAQAQAQAPARHADVILTDGGYEARRCTYADTPLEDESTGIDMVYSSGTTGRPKGIKPAVPPGPIDVPDRVTLMATARYGVNADTVYLSPAPLYHAAPLRWSMAVQRLGGTVVVMRKFDAAETLHLIAQARVTHAQFVPTHFARLLDLSEEVRKAADLSSLKVVIHAAAPCPVPVKHKMMDWFGPIIWEFYGGSEGIGNAIVSPTEWLERPGTVGRAHNCEIRICDEAGEHLPAGRIGTVYLAHGQSFEYFNDPVKTAKAYNQYGWATLGDMGYVDEEGYLFLTDRKDFMIISGGVNIYPQEIEDALLTHPAVRDAAVVAAPHPDLGERVAAVIELREGALAGPELAQDLRAFLRERLSPVKLPRRIDFLPELPRLPTGKLMKRLLRDAYFGHNAELAASLRKGLEI